ncbi:MAG: HAD family hydrolase [Bacteroidales bacterium]|nr:HAD family hydrolase [Bacteroidales bacterium]
MTTVALIYDFDGTLSPANMQEFGLIQTFGSNPAQFWNKSNTLSEMNDASEILCYMKTMIDEAKAKGVTLSRESFRKFGSMVKLYPGVSEWFSQINSYGAERGIDVVHYINSSGLTEMIEGTSIYNEFKKVYACSFLYENGEAIWPAVAVDYTAKTQFLFKINKGVHSIRDHSLVNQFLPESERPVPFSRMIYFGDGATDIPCMKLVKQFGGHSIAVYNPEGDNYEKSKQLYQEQRVHFVCPADYSKGGKIWNVVTSIIEKIKTDVELKSLEG